MPEKDRSLAIDRRLKYLSPKDIILTGKEDKRPESIPIESIVVEQTLIDPGHVQTLKKSMLGKRGQLSPITVRARLEQGEVVYDIIDGFHRVAALKEIIKEGGSIFSADAIVVYGCDDEELFDLRITAACSVKEVKFIRRIEWMQKSFESTRWTNPRLSVLISEGNLTVTQVFSLALTGTGGQRLGLTNEEAEEVKKWAWDKTEQWEKPISVIFSELHLADRTDPDLIKQVRTGGHGKDRGGKIRKGVLTLARLKAIVDELPGEWKLQRRVVGLVIKNNLVATQAKQLSKAISEAHNSENEKRMILIFSDPLSFAGSPNPLNHREDEDELNINQIKPKTDGERGKNIINPRSPILKEVSNKNLKQERESMLQIIQNQKERIENLEDIVNSRTSTREKYQDKYILLKKKWGDITFDIVKGFVGAKEIGFTTLSPKENQILKLLIDNKGIPITPSLIEVIVTGDSFTLSDSDLIRVQIKDLRDKLNNLLPALASKIQTVPGYGYCWAED